MLVRRQVVVVHRVLQLLAGGCILWNHGLVLVVWSKKSQNQSSNLSVCAYRQANIMVGSVKL